MSKNSLLSVKPFDLFLYFLRIDLKEKWDIVLCTDIFICSKNISMHA